MQPVHVHTRHVHRQCSSESSPALEVVRPASRRSGLGLFCLELHSHKTRKDSLLNDLATGIDAQSAFGIRQRACCRA